VPKPAPTRSEGIWAQIGPEQAPAQDSCPRTSAPVIDPAYAGPQANVRRTSALTGRVLGALDRRDRPAASLQAVASGEDGADPDHPSVIGEALSQEVTPGRLVSSATVEPAAWAAVVVASAAVVVASAVVAVAVGVAAGADGDRTRNTDETRSTKLCRVNHSFRH